MTDKEKGFLTAPRLRQIPRLVHGFGNGALRLEDLSWADEHRRLHPVVMNQLHSDIVHVIDGPPENTLEGDALVTGRPGLLLVVKTADCLPVLLADDQRRVIAAVHCGWRSTLKRILSLSVRAMRRSFGTNPGDLVAALGPCIGPSCYEVGADVAGSFEASGFPEDVVRAQPGRRDKYLLDLARANEWLLAEEGLRKTDIFVLNGCTHCDRRLFSHRRDRTEEGRMFNFIGMI